MGHGAVPGWGHCLGALGRAKATISRELRRNALPQADIRRFMPLEPVNCAGGAGSDPRTRGRFTSVRGGGSARGRGMDARTDLRLVEIRERTAVAGHRLARQSTPSSIGPAQKAEALWRYLTRRHKRRRFGPAPGPRATPSRIERRSMIVRRALKAAARLAIGRAISSFANAHGLCSSCMSESRGSRSPRGSQGKPPQKPSQRCSRCSVASILNCEDQITFDNDTAFAQHGLLSDHARYDDLVLRRLCLMAKKAALEKRQWTLTSMAAAPLRHIDWTSDQEIQEIVLTTNLTPRKCLGLKTPFQALIAELGKDVRGNLASLKLRVALRSRIQEPRTPWKSSSALAPARRSRPFCTVGSMRSRAGRLEFASAPSANGIGGEIRHTHGKPCLPLSRSRRSPSARPISRRFDPSGNHPWLASVADAHRARLWAVGDAWSGDRSASRSTAMSCSTLWLSTPAARFTDDRERWPARTSDSTAGAADLNQFLVARRRTQVGRR